jgi:hypothetical protein
MFDGRCTVELAADSLDAALRAAFAGIGVAGVVAAAWFASGVVACAGTCSCTRCDGALAGVAVASAGAKVRAATDCSSATGPSTSEKTTAALAVAPIAAETSAMRTVPGAGVR